MIFQITVFRLPEKEYLIIPGHRSNEDLPPAYRGDRVKVFDLKRPVHHIYEAYEEIYANVNTSL